MAIFTMDGKVLAANRFYKMHHEAEREDLFNAFGITGYERRTGIWCAIGQTTDFDATGTVECSYGPLPPEYMNACNFNYDDLQGMKKAEEMFHVVPDSTSGDILFSSYDSTAGMYVDQYYRTVDEADIYDESAHWIYIKFVLKYTELPIVSFRQIGLFYNPELDPAHGGAGYGATVISKSEIVPVGTARGPGILFYYSNIETRYRHQNQKDIIEVIIQF